MLPAAQYSLPGGSRAQLHLTTNSVGATLVKLTRLRSGTVTPAVCPTTRRVLLLLRRVGLGRKRCPPRPNRSGYDLVWKSASVLQLEWAELPLFAFRDRSVHEVPQGRSVLWLSRKVWYFPMAAMMSNNWKKLIVLIVFVVLLIAAWFIWARPAEDHRDGNEGSSIVLYSTTLRT